MVRRGSDTTVGTGVAPIVAMPIVVGGEDARG